VEEVAAGAAIIVHLKKVKIVRLEEVEVVRLKEVEVVRLEVEVVRLEVEVVRLVTWGFRAWIAPGLMTTGGLGGAGAPAMEIGSTSTSISVI
jgi:hypothetical protein